MNKFKSISAMLLAIMMILTALPFSASAEAVQSGTCGENLTWTLDENGTLTISGTGEMYNYGDNRADWYTARYMIKNVIIQDGVTSIGRQAFFRGDSLINVTIPDSVTKIGDGAFEFCDLLTSVTISENVTSIGQLAFAFCSGIKDLKISNNVTEIKMGAFAFCDGLTSIAIPHNVVTLEEGVFLGCAGLTDITVSENNKNYCDIDGVLFNADRTVLIQCPGGKTGEYLIPDGVISIGKGSFSECGNLTAVAVPESVTTIGDSAFYNCKNIERITIYGDVESIGEDAFYVEKSTSIQGGEISGGIISDYNIPVEYVKAEQKPLSGTCGENLTWELDENGTLTISGTGDMYWTDYVGNGGLISNNGGSIYNNGIGQIKAAADTSIERPETDWNYYNIPWYDYSDMIKKVIINEGVASIGRNAFYNCSNLTNVTIPESVISIGIDAFTGYNNLTINCYKGSYADTYALENKIPVKYIDAEPAADVFVFKAGNNNAYYSKTNSALPIGASCEMIGGKTYVPFRVAAVAAGISDLKYDSVTGVITFTGVEGYTAEMKAGSAICRLTSPDGSDKIDLSVSAPIIKNGLTYLPVRDISSLTGCFIKFANDCVVVSANQVAEADIQSYIEAFEKL